MASSLSPSCNPPKQAYDTCFNSWFKSYLLVIAPPLPGGKGDGKEEQKAARDKRNAEILKKRQELEESCGGKWKDYQGCLKREIPTKEDLPSMLETARQEEPLDGWGGIKVVTEEDLK